MNKLRELEKAEYIEYTSSISGVTAEISQTPLEGVRLKIVERGVITKDMNFSTFALVLNHIVEMEIHSYKEFLKQHLNVFSIKPNKIRDLIIAKMVIDPVRMKMARIKEHGANNECTGYLYHGNDSIYAIYCENGLWFAKYKNAFGYDTSTIMMSSFEELLEWFVQTEKPKLNEAYTMLNGWVAMPALTDEMIRDGILKRIDV